MRPILPQCIITGCIFVDTGSGRYLVGDLFQINTNTFAFNGNCNQKDGKASWVYGPQFEVEDRKVISLKRGGIDYFEKRGVVVLSRDQFEFNEAAAEYVKKVLQ